MKRKMIENVLEQIVIVENSIKALESVLNSCSDVAEINYLRSEKEHLRKKEEQLRTKEEQLRTKEEQLREEKLILLRAQQNHLGS